VTALVMAAAVALSAAGGSLPVTLLVLSLAPWVSVVGYEIAGHRHNAEVLASLSDRHG
jgi:N-acetyl-gamma-glutamylphosphate reductase